MLPASPRPGRSGSRQPAQYRSQARSVSRPREREVPARSMDYESATTSRDRERAQRSNTIRQVRPQRSMGSLPSSSRVTLSREAVPPMPRPYNTPPKSADPGPSSWQKSTPRSSSTSSDASSSSVVTPSSSGSSFLNRMKARYPGGSSSQTSLESEQQESPKEEGGKQWYGSRERKMARQTEAEPAQERRNRNMNTTTQPQGPTQGSGEDSSYTSYGYSIWDRIATAANSLAENVNIAWAANNFTGSIEDVPGQETNLTKTLKAYYLGKARSRAELPEWLFSEEERRGPSGISTSRQDDDRNYDDQAGVRMPDIRRRGFRDAGAPASAPVSPPGRRSEGDNAGNTWAVDDSSSGYGGSKATNRLRALRDAKRQAALAGRGAQSISGPTSTASATATAPAPTIKQVGYEPSNRRIGADDPGRSRSQYNNNNRQGGAGERQERQVPSSRVGLPANPRRR